MTSLVERLREKANAYVGDIFDEAANRIETLEKEMRELLRIAEANGHRTVVGLLTATLGVEAMSGEFDWRSAYRKEHADLCAVEGRNYVLEKALREIATRIYETGHELQAIARKALGEEAVEKTLMEEVAELRAVFNGTLGEE